MRCSLAAAAALTGPDRSMWGGCTVASLYNLVRDTLPLPAPAPAACAASNLGGLMSNQSRSCSAGGLSSVCQPVVEAASSLRCWSHNKPRRSTYLCGQPAVGSAPDAWRSQQCLGAYAAQDELCCPCTLYLLQIQWVGACWQLWPPGKACWPCCCATREVQRCPSLLQVPLSVHACQRDVQAQTGGQQGLHIH